MSQAPRIIAAIVRATLQDLNAADEKLGQRVRRALDPEALRAIERSSGLSWLPVEIDVMLTETLFELAGAFAAKRTLRSMMTTSVGSPLMRNVVQTAMRLHGSDVARLLTWTPKVWALVYRNCGTVTIESDGLGSVIRLRELPEVLCKSPVYLTGTAATIEAFLQAIDVDATVRLEGPRRDTRQASFRLRWMRSGTSLPAPG